METKCVESQQDSLVSEYNDLQATVREFRERVETERQEMQDAFNDLREAMGLPRRNWD